MKIDEGGRFSPSLSPLATSTPEKSLASQRTEGILQVEGNFRQIFDARRKPRNIILAVRAALDVLHPVDTSDKTGLLVLLPALSWISPATNANRASSADAAQMSIGRLARGLRGTENGRARGARHARPQRLLADAASTSEGSLRFFLFPLLDSFVVVRCGVLVSFMLP